MITILPRSTETWVVAFSIHEVEERLARATTSKLLIQNKIHDKAVKFTGHIQQGRFRISRKVTRPNSFLPLVIGTIDPTSSGCILFLKYKLFPSTRMYLLFWLSFAMLMGTILSYQYKDIVLMAGIVLIMACILGVAWANFNIQLRLTRSELQNVLGNSGSF